MLSEDKSNNIKQVSESSLSLTELSSNQGWRQIAKCSTHEARNCLSEAQATKFQVLPLGVLAHKTKEILTVASPFDDDIELIKSLKFATGKEIRLIKVDENILGRAIQSAYSGDDSILTKKIEVIKSRNPSEKNRNDLILDFRASTGDAATLLSALVDYAIAKGASDLHFVPRAEGSSIKLRIDGELYIHEGAICSHQLLEHVVARLRVLCKLPVSNRAHPQDGSFNIPYGGESIDIRVNILPTIFGEKAALRFLGMQEVPDILNLGLPDKALRFIMRIVAREEGALLLAGPTGSGKTTTLYSILKHLARSNRNIITIEDPVEIKMPGITQSQINEIAGCGFAQTIKAILRQDPDVILMGEMRDSESASIAMQAAMTGHLLLSTIHARDILGVFSRCWGLNIDPHIILQSLRVIIVQKLLPKLCQECRVFDLHSYRKFNSQETGQVVGEIFKAAGCLSCDFTGYQGRVIACEALDLNEEFVSALLENPKRPDLIKKHFYGDNYLSYKDSLIMLLSGGLISYNEVQNSL